MIAHADLTATHIEVRCPARMKQLIAEIPGSRFVARSDDLWRLPRTMNAAVQLVGQLGFAHLEMSTALKDQAGWWKFQEATHAQDRAAALDPSRWADQDGLYGYQAAALQWLRDVGSAVLGDDAGTGKTAMASHWVRDSGPLLVICPKAVQRNWVKELAKFRPDIGTAVLLDGTATKRRKILDAHNGEVPLVVSYDQLPLHSRLAPYGAVKLTEDQKAEKELNAIPFAQIIADEAHRLFNQKTRWTMAYNWLRSRAERALLLTGTPSENSPLEFWSLLHAAAPDEWPSQSKARDYYMQSSPGFWGGIQVTGLRTDRRDEWDRLVARRFLRRPKSLVLPFLPPKVYETRTYALPPKLRKQYDEAKRDAILMLDFPEMLKNSALLHTRLVQAASATLESVGTELRTYVRADGGEEEREVPIVRMVEPSPKVDAAMDALSDLQGAPVMISAASRQLLNLMSERLTKKDIRHAMIAGGMRPDEIEHAKDQYNSGEVDILLLSVSSAAEGLSLTRGSTIIRLDRAQKRLQNSQATDRLHGTGRGDHDAQHLLIIDLVAEDTAEERVLENLANKDQGFEDLFQDEAAIRKALS